ncbi:NADH:ubiquinone oxidoreductase [Alistipes sp. An54]|uniref:NADH-quinone oxidoreductase subunit B family protein n=1 Tax=Alistipes sp. An54 TaxID=1965645 RepID=UPI000B39DA6F|nr:NADH:ubiquinone oxidoreductase [Alistipes sp. An54]OUN76932.1 NADH:ubiquinone oxidoreductase [Alistipes sp. An54]
MILPKIRVLRSHGQQAIEDLDAVELTEEFRGRPELTFTEDTTEAERAEALCPTGAFRADPLELDLGRCLFCGECARVAPRNVRFTNDYRIGSPTREGLVLHAGDSRVEFDPKRVRPEIRRCFRQALQLREVSAGGDGSVEMELNATGNVNFDLGRYGIGFTASPRHADGVVVSGPLTAQIAEALEICYDAVAEPKILVMCGTEACSGGLFAESRALDRSFLDSHTPDLWLPGAPTHPMTCIDGLLTLLGRKNRL